MPSFVTCFYEPYGGLYKATFVFIGGCVVQIQIWGYLSLYISDTLQTLFWDYDQLGQCKFC